MSLGKILGAAVLGAALIAPVSSAQAAGQVVINGSTTVLPVVQKASESFMAAHPNIALSISGGGSGNGIKALIEGQCAIAMSSRDMHEKEKKAAKAKNVNPVRTAIAFDAIVPVVHPNNPVKAMTSAQLRDIYAGKIKNWKEVGGKDAKIVVISRDTSSGTFECWNELIMKKTRVMPGALMQASNGAVVQAIAKNPNAIGYIGMGYLDKTVHTMVIDGVEATAENAVSRTWPISRELLLFTNGEPAGDVKMFMDYMLDPTKGQKDVVAAGYVPMPVKK